MTYFSMFSGIGGFELGIQQAYGNKIGSSEQVSEQKSVSDGWDSLHSPSERDWKDGNEYPTCIGYSEIDKYAIQIYERHFNHKNYGDATRINPTELPDFDLLVGGFPCQAFSIAGKRGGLEDSRGTLFYDIARIAKEKRPQHLLLENVKGLLSHDNGRTFKLIISTFAELGYNLEWQVLNSKNFGVPQNRERVFIIGHLGRCCGRQVFPLGQTDRTTNKGFNQNDTEVEVASTIRSRYGNGSGSHIQQLNQPTHSNNRVYGADGISPTLNTMQGGNRQPFVAPVLTPDRLEKRQNGRRFKENGEPSFTLTSQDKHGVMVLSKDGKQKRKNFASTLTGGGHSSGNHSDMDLLLEDMRIRRLTPTECERLQAYPDGWTEGVSDTQRYKTLGNGVTVNVVQHLIQKLYE